MRRRLGLVAFVPLLGGLVACGGGNNGDSPAGPGAEACTSLPTADPAATLPAGFPALPEQVLHAPATQGSTKIVFALVAEPDFVDVRDQVVARLRDAGYTIVGSDQESVEAEAEFTGKHEGTIKVQPFCKGRVTVRYKLNQ